MTDRVRTGISGLPTSRPTNWTTVTIAFNNLVQSAGGAGEGRTHGTPLQRRKLYQLSYGPIGTSKKKTRIASNFLDRLFGSSDTEFLRTQ